MADPTLLGLYYVLSISQVVLMLFAVFFAYHIIRTVGTFWAWTLMVIAFSLLAVRDFTSVASVLATPVAGLTPKTDMFTVTSYWPGVIINESAYGTLVAGIYGLSKIFKMRVAEEAPHDDAARPETDEKLSSLMLSRRGETVSDGRKLSNSRAHGRGVERDVPQVANLRTTD